jgi:hypothetical protein
MVVPEEGDGSLRDDGVGALDETVSEEVEEGKLVLVHYVRRIRPQLGPQLLDGSLDGLFCPRWNRLSFLRVSHHRQGTCTFCGTDGRRGTAAGGHCFAAVCQQRPCRVDAVKAGLRNDCHFVITVAWLRAA